MKTASVFITLLFGSFFAFSQNSLHPEASTIWDAYFPYGAHKANSNVLFPVIPTIGYSPQATSQSFYFDSDVDTYRDAIAELKSRGIQYYMFLEFNILEADPNQIIADDPNISDPDFGAFINLDSSFSYINGFIARSINRPAWRDFFIRCIRRGIDAGADGIQIDMAGEQNVQSFDPDDLAGFRQYMRDHYDPLVWQNEGIGNIDTLDYRKWLLSKGITYFPNSFDVGWIPLGKYWIRYKIDKIQETWRMISDSARIYAQEKYGRDFNIVGNNAYIGIFQQHGALTMGDIAGEYFDYAGYPKRGTTTLRHKIVQSLGRRNLIWSLPTNDPGCQCSDGEFNAHMVAEAFASGGLAQYATDKESVGDYFYLVQQQRALFDSVKPFGEVGVILGMPTTVMEFGILDYHYGAQLLMQDLFRSYEVIAFGTNFGWPDTIQLSTLERFPLILLHEGDRITAHQQSLLLQYVQNGGKLIVFAGPGLTGSNDEHGNPLNNTVWNNMVGGNTRITDYGSGKFAYLSYSPVSDDGFCKYYYRHYAPFDATEQANMLALKNLVNDYVDSLFRPENEIVNTAGKIKIFRSQTDQGDMMLYHLINYRLDENTRLHIPQNNLEIKLRLTDTLAKLDSVTVTFYSPDNVQGSSHIRCNVENGMADITVPELFIWTMINIEPAINSQAIHLTGSHINNVIKPYRLKANTMPVVSWKTGGNLQEYFKVEIWENAINYGSPVYSSQWINSSDTTFSCQNANLNNGQTYLLRLAVKDGQNHADSINIPFNINSPPLPPVHYYGISGIILTDENLPFYFDEATDAENDSLLYFWQILTDSLYDNYSDSVNLYLLYTSDFTQHDPSLGLDGIYDTLKQSIDVDNFGFWWRVFSFDGIDTSAQSNWSRWTWDKVNDPPRDFNLISPANGTSVIQNSPLKFSWENNGDMDPSSPTIQSWNLLMADDPDFTVSVNDIFTSVPEMNINNLAGHHPVYWKVKAKDAQGLEKYSNQVRRLYVDDGSNTPPDVPVLQFPEDNSNTDSIFDFTWERSFDNQSDSVYYQLEIADNDLFTDILYFAGDIPDTNTSTINYFSDNLPKGLLINGNEYYWRVKSYDRYVNGNSDYSQVFRFTYNTATTSVSNLENISIKVYPNPSNHYIHVDNPGNNKGMLIKIVDTKGRVVYVKNFAENNIKINISTFKKGLYLILIISGRTDNKVMFIKD